MQSTRFSPRHDIRSPELPRVIPESARCDSQNKMALYLKLHCNLQTWLEGQLLLSPLLGVSGSAWSLVLPYGPGRSWQYSWKQPAMPRVHLGLLYAESVHGPAPASQLSTCPATLGKLLPQLLGHKL